ncbi:cobalt-precorrin-5B (C(1))-methyltransferase CbiD [Desulfolutivibrio sulfoxidireducens]|uniref:cobalt-precorrin-5B (C(1))-methyltransferase CbiD n=1 Tax=Desulfolutivibrio sulfoxidireducens TaxID=2773299 RepID=UPI00159E7867|nr:cobalt-precorrin-5B (C(1))-methyltransferase CbiD [Desulfolutivibrio sulfoxidireducens]QLA14906.1 cobalamin biosynthesis protein CbiD [Desulfolutivibrio sulfoxidireducens]QLA18472.1 cobalamin biosynthesis protein CbiD [Desulfolutivibrio sulfoxidireducens]
MAERAGLREGFTTGTAAAAAAKAATLVLFGRPADTFPALMDVPLPGTGRLTVPVAEATVRPDGHVRAVTVKDGGDDPDVTHMARIGCTVSLDDALSAGEVGIEGGAGVGRVTLPGLPVPVGRPAINPGPMAQIRAAVIEALPEPPPARGVSVIVDVEDGEGLAGRTMNPRLGIVGGVSILGTSGIVRPFSHESWRAAIAEALDVARAMGARHVVLSTGRRSERAARRLLPGLADQAFVQMADYFSFSLSQAALRGFEEITLCAYPGKLVKMGMGLSNTHADIEATDFQRLATWCREAGLPSDLAGAVAKANTVRHAFGLVRPHPRFPALAALLVQKALVHAGSFTTAALGLIALDFDDSLLPPEAQTRGPDLEGRLGRGKFLGKEGVPGD